MNMRGEPGMPGGMDLSGAQFGLMSNMRTGNMILDTAICLLIPLIFGIVLRQLEGLRVWWDTKGHTYLEGALRRNREYTRTIIYERRTNSWGSELHNGNSWNNLLQKAITLYLAERKLKMQRGAVSLMTLNHRQPNHYYNDDDDKDKDSPADQLSKYRMACEPAQHTWTEVVPGIFFLRSEDVEDNNSSAGSVTTTTVTFTIRCSEPNGDTRINTFLEDAYQFYQNELRKQQDNSRYFYNMLSGQPAGGDGGEGGGGGSAAHRMYKRYKLSDEKTFKSLFFPDKEQLLSLLQHFKEKTGKYAIEGYPHKLGLLLHGPPGTGKTSLIKALAHHTNRHIVSIPLSRLKTNQELMDLIFDQVFHIAGEDMPVRLKYKDVVFVMEDVDAASSIVHARKPAIASTTTVRITRETSIPAAPLTDRSVSFGNTQATPVSGRILQSIGLPRDASVGIGRDFSAGSILSTGEDGSIKIRRETVIEVGEQSPHANATCLDGSTAIEESDVDESSTVKMGPETQDDAELVKAVLKGEKSDKEKKSSTDDKLDLAGLLNVLDGVIDCPGRIVIMTSNHPEKLDPALIRPGRIDKRMLLDYLQADCSLQMISHYFQAEMTDEQKEETRRIFANGPRLTPAVVEQLCAEHDTLSDFLKALAKAARQSLRDPIGV